MIKWMSYTEHIQEEAACPTTTTKLNPQTETHAITEIDKFKGSPDLQKTEDVCSSDVKYPPRSSQPKTMVPPVEELCLLLCAPCIEFVEHWELRA
jgi:hypothetical protein